MKVIICTKYGSPEVLKIKEIETPVPRDNEILVKNFATSVSKADTRIRSFSVPLAFWIPGRLALGITKPKKNILGGELAGRIESVGKDVKNFKQGDEVFAATGMEFGTYAQYVCIPEDGVVAIKPANISFQQAAVIPIGARTALYYLRKANIKKGQKVLIYGASGSVGSYAVQIAKFLGAEVTAVCSSTNIDLVKNIGADKVIDYTDNDFSLGYNTYDVILEAVNKSSFLQCNKALKEEGVYINVAAAIKTLAMLWVSMTSKKKIIPAPPSEHTDYITKSEPLLFLKKLVEEGKISPLIDQEFGMEQIIEAHRYVDKGHKKGNVVIRMNTAAQ
ncbi:MAG: NAD(P)-dependent alcohol dehydrogenase [Fluviicola sp.]|nr:MAG: NAD(P)-dependent alcohol dehydrogenase [Fluviicola sp.]